LSVLIIASTPYRAQRIDSGLRAAVILRKINAARRTRLPTKCRRQIVLSFRGRHLAPTWTRDPRDERSFSFWFVLLGIAAQSSTFASAVYSGASR
jgi:hypothetical protein